MDIKGILKTKNNQEKSAGDMFLECPEGNFCRINIFGEVSHLSNFIEEDLYFFYEFYLPPGYKLDDENDYYQIKKDLEIEPDLTLKLKSISQISSTYINPYSFSFTKPDNFSFRYMSNSYKSNEDEFKNTNTLRLHNFSCPFDIELLGHFDVINLFAPKLLFQINSVDYLGKHRVEGYSFVDIPMISGNRQICAPCYKPQEDLYLKEYSFFLGGSRVIPDLTELVKTAEKNEYKQDIPLNRYGIKTEYVGEICVNLNVVIQDKRIQDKYRVEIKNKKPLEDYYFYNKIQNQTGEKLFDYQEVGKPEQMQTKNFTVNRQGS